MAELYQSPGWIILIMVETLVIIVLAVFLRTKHNNRDLLREKKAYKVFINEMIQAFAKCIDIKDEYTNGHSFRVADYSVAIAKKLGYEGEDLENVYNTALLHDIGKISIPDEILHKKGKPTKEEYDVIKQHPAMGMEILKNITIIPEISIGAGYHHERLDGKGYPFGLMVDEIPYIAQIIAVADTFDAMYSTRPYRPRMELEVVKDELKRVSGTQLNKEIVDAFLELIEEGKINTDIES